MMARVRTLLARFLGQPDDAHLAFTSGATDALNLAIHGLLREGDRVVVAATEHNAVVRPLQEWVAHRSVQLEILPADSQGRISPDGLKPLLNRPTRLVVVAHASNVTGAIAPIAEIAALAREAGAFTLVDAAQTAGALTLDFDQLGVDLLAVTGHKALLGPPGTGALVARPGLPLRPARQGGTGIQSEQPLQPGQWPEGFEAGTPNTPGIAGLGAALEFLQSVGGPVAVRVKELALIRRLWDGLKSIPGVRAYGPDDPAQRVGLVAFNIKGWDPSEAALALEADSGVHLRSGLHCAPAAHRALGTFPTGTLRASAGFYNTPEEVDILLDGVDRLARRAN